MAFHDSHHTWNQLQSPNKKVSCISRASHQVHILYQIPTYRQTIVEVGSMEDKIDPEIRRVLLKFVVLKTIKDRPTHGYEIIHHIKEITGGRWTPSAGSIYPILERLETNGHIRSEEIERKRVYTITPKGVNALDQMIQKKMDFIRETAIVINKVTDEDAGTKKTDCRSQELQ